MLVTDEALCGIIQDTWTSTLGFAVERAAAGHLPAAGTTSVCVRISGEWNGEVQLHCSVALARSIAAAIFQVNADAASNDEMLDALSELIHIVGGNLKPLLPQPVTVSLPCLPGPTDGEHTPPFSRMIHHLTLLSEGCPFTVSLWENTSPPTL